MAGELEVERESLEREAIGGIEGRKGFGRGERNGVMGAGRDSGVEERE